MCLAVALLFFILVLPVAAALWPGSNGFEGGTSYPVSSKVSMTPPKGWVLDEKNSTLGQNVEADKGSATIRIQPSSGSKSDVDSVIEQYRETYRSDDENHYVVSEASATSTDGGLSGQTFTAVGKARCAQVWVLFSSGQLIVVEGSGGAPQWPADQPDIESMVDSLRVDAS